MANSEKGTALIFLRTVSELGTSRFGVGAAAGIIVVKSKALEPLPACSGLLNTCYPMLHPFAHDVQTRRFCHWSVTVQYICTYVSLS